MSRIASHLRPVAPATRRLVAALTLLALLAAWQWMNDRELRRMASLPPETRQRLLERSLASLASVCVGADARRFESYCREQASIALHLPECDEPCVRTARAFLVYPTR